MGPEQPWMGSRGRAAGAGTCQAALDLERDTHRGPTPVFLAHLALRGDSIAVGRTFAPPNPNKEKENKSKWKEVKEEKKKTLRNEKALVKQTISQGFFTDKETRELERKQKTPAKENSSAADGCSAPTPSLLAPAGEDAA